MYIGLDCDFISGVIECISSQSAGSNKTSSVECLTVFCPSFRTVVEMRNQWQWPHLLAVAVFLVFPLVHSRDSGTLANGLIVTSPQLWLAGSMEKTCIVSHGLAFDVRVSISLTRNNRSVLSSKTVTLPPGGSECAEVQVPSGVSGSDVKLLVEAESVDSNNFYNFSKSASVTIKTPEQTTFIQTDKPMYKPADLVRIRIMTLKGPDLLLLTDEISLVYIEDPTRTRVMQWANISNVKGLTSLEMQLSDEPRLGEWTIKALIKKQTESQKFLVQEYVLPKYEVTIEHPSYLSHRSSDVTWKACARYTYGQPVSGNITSKACIIREYMPPNRKPTCHHMDSTKLKDGCAQWSFNSSSLNLDEFRWGGKIEFFAGVKERGTNVKLNTTLTVVIHSSILKLTFLSEGSSHYKPGLPFYGSGTVTFPDGKPARGKIVKIHTTFTAMNSNDRLLPFRDLELTTSSDGSFQYILPGNFTGQDLKSISQEASVEDKQAQHPTRINKVLKPWYSPSNSFLQIEPFDEVASCKSTLSLPVIFLTPNASSLSFHFQLIARGDIVHTGRHSVSLDDAAQNVTKDGNAVYKFEVTFMVTYRMSEHLKLLVFTILPSGETVADSLLISVEKCFNNHVSMRFADGQKQPGHSTVFSVTADPDSLCSVLVVDKSVTLLTTNENTVSKPKVFSMLNQYDISRNLHGRNYGMENEEGCGFIKKEIIKIGRHKRHWVNVPALQNHRQRRMIMFPSRMTSNYVDAKEAFENAGMIVLSDLAVVTKPCQQNIMEHGYHLYHSYGIPHSVEDDFDDFSLPLPMETSSALSSFEEKPRKESPVLHRNFFPESWLWQLKFVGDAGVEDMTLEIPHTITEWIGSGFCSNTQTGLGVSSPFSINAFQPFFLSFTVPYSVIRGERVGIPVSVFNYLNQCLKVTLFVQKSSAFELINDLPVRELTVCGHKTETHTYSIEPRELGNINFTIRATSVASGMVETNSVDDQEITTAADIVTQVLLVEAEGKEEELTKSAFVCAPGNGTWSMDLPDAAIVPDSLRTHTSIIGDVMGPTLTGLESLLALPTGCGEQNMLKFSPNIFVMHYLQKTNSLTEAVKKTATGYLQTGYQRELTYRHADGSYSAFGSSDKEGSSWLTAFVIKSFAQAKPFIHIDQNDLDKSIRWLTSTQLENGCFPQTVLNAAARLVAKAPRHSSISDCVLTTLRWLPISDQIEYKQIGIVLHKEMKGGLANGQDSLAGLTAYVVVALMEAGVKPRDPVIFRAFQCLNIQQVEDVYTKSLMVYAYTMWGDSDAKQEEFMQSMQTEAVVADGTKHWSVPGEDSSSSSPVSIEMTSYMLLSILHNNSLDSVVEATSIVRWLTTQRNSRGGFSSTQDTVIALQALSQFAALVHSDTFDANALITGTAWSHSASITNDNRLLLHKREGRALPSKLNYDVSGTGCVLLQASLKYNTMNYQSDEEPAFLLRAEVHRLKTKNCKERSLKICTRYNGVDNVTNMAVISVKMVSGWIPDKDSVKKLMNHAYLNLKRYEIDKNTVQLYFEKLDKMEKCLTFNVYQYVVVSKTKPVLVHVYDYYHPSLSTYAKYDITSTCGTKEEIVDTGNDALESKNNSLSQARIQAAVPSFLGLNKTSNKPDKKSSKSVCPECDLKNSTEIRNRYCSAPFVYEVLAVNKTTLTIQTQARSKDSVNRNVSFRLPKKCKCAPLDKSNGASAMLLLTKEIQLKKHKITLSLDKDAIIIKSSKLKNIVQKAPATICP